MTKFNKNLAQSLPEWTVVITCITVVVMATVLALGPKMKQILTKIDNGLIESQKNQCEEQHGTWDEANSSCI